MRPEKKILVEEYKKQLSGSSFLFLTQFTGMNVIQMDELRKRLHDVAAECHVVKNSVLAIAAKECGLEVNGNLTGQTAVIYGRAGKKADAAAAAKALRGFMKETEKPAYKGAFMDGKKLSEPELIELANLPSREVLLAKLLGLLNTPAQQLLYVLNAKPSEFLAVLKAYEEKQKETQGKS